MCLIMVVIGRRQNLPKEIISKNVGDLYDCCTSLEKKVRIVHCNGLLKHQQWVNARAFSTTSCARCICAGPRNPAPFICRLFNSVWQGNLRGTTPATTVFLTHASSPVASMDFLVSFSNAVKTALKRRQLANNHRPELHQNRTCLTQLT